MGSEQGDARLGVAGWVMQGCWARRRGATVPRAHAQGPPSRPRSDPPPLRCHLPGSLLALARWLMQQGQAGQEASQADAPVRRAVPARRSHFSNAAAKARARRGDHMAPSTVPGAARRGARTSASVPSDARRGRPSLTFITAHAWQRRDTTRRATRLPMLRPVEALHRPESS